MIRKTFIFKGQLNPRIGITHAPWCRLILGHRKAILTAQGTGMGHPNYLGRFRQLRLCRGQGMKFITHTCLPRVCVPSCHYA